MKIFLPSFLSLAFTKSKTAFIDIGKNKLHNFESLKNTVSQLKFLTIKNLMKNPIIKTNSSFAITLVAFFIGFSVSGQALIVSNGETIIISSNTSYTSLLVKNGGTLIVNSPAILRVGTAGTPATRQVVDLQNGSTVLINVGASLVVNGLLNNSNNSGITFDGTVQVNGNVKGGNGSAIDGSGSLNSTGSMITDNTGTIFGSTGDCLTGPCSGNTLCGRRVTASSSLSSICTGSNSTVRLTGTISLGSGTGTYQWQSRTTSTGAFTNIDTGEIIFVSPNTTTTYRLLLTVSGCLSQSNAVVVTVSKSPSASIFGNGGTICSTDKATVGVAFATNGTILWTHNGGGSLTQGATTTPIYTSVASDAGNTVTLTMTVSNNQCPSATATYSIIVSSCVRTWTGATSADWAANANWSPSIAPTTIDDVVIPSSVVSGRMPVLSSSMNAKSVSNSGTLTITSTGTLNTYGNISNTGTLNTLAASTIVFKGNGAQTITGVPVLYNVQIANTSGGVSLLSAITVKGAITLTSGILTTNSNLTINFDNGGNIAYNVSDAGSISGDVSGRRDAIARSHYISAPFTGATSAQIQATTPLFVNTYWKMYTKNFTTQGWAAVTNTTTAMPLGTGFSLSMPAAAPLILTGTYNHSHSNTGETFSNAAAEKYILIGNPYPSALDWNAVSGWTKTNVADAVYYWNATNNTVSTYIAGAATNGATQYIPAMQSFMVTTTGTGGTSSVSINNAARVNLQNPSFMRSGSDETIRIKLTGATPDVWDDAVIRFNEMATTSFDNDWDAYKIINRGSSPLIYTTLGGEDYSINSVSVVDSIPGVDVMLYLPADGNYTLNVANSDPAIDYILVDKKLGTDNVLLASGYAFNGNTTDGVNRFELKLRTTLTTGTNTGNESAGLHISSSTKGFVIQSKQYSGSIASIEIMDITGKLIQVISDKSLSEVSYIPLDITEGSYMIKVTIDNTVFAQMITLTR